MNPLDDLRQVLPPPKRPIHNDDDWSAVETAIGLRFPTDYKAFIDVYGRGTINNCLDIESPFGLKTEVRTWWVNFAAYFVVAELLQVGFSVNSRG